MAPTGHAYPLHADREEQMLRETWLSPAGFLGWFTHVNQRMIGKRFIITAFVFFLMAGVLGILIRWQLAFPQNQFLGPELYNQIFTVHGTAMMFLFAIPVMEGFAIYLVPLMIGTRDMAFPRLSAFGYYVYLIGGIVFLARCSSESLPEPDGTITCRWPMRSTRLASASGSGPR